MKHKNNPFLGLLENYFTVYIPVAKGLSNATIKSYKTTFRLLIEFMASVKSISADGISFSNLDDRTILEFLDWLQAERGCSISTRNQRMSGIAAFSIYAQNRDFEAATSFRNNVLKIPKKKAPSQKRTFFTRDEVKALFELPDFKTVIGLRDKTLLCFMYASGTRAQEVCNLKVGDIQFFPDRAGLNIHGKGNKVRRIGIPKQAASMLKKYIDYRGISSKQECHVFSSQTHEKMTVSCIEEIYTKYIDKAKKEYPGLFRDHYTPHSMRHTTASHMLEAGVPLFVVKNFLGHVSIQTTQIYAAVTQDTMNQQLKAWNDKWFLKHETDTEPAGTKTGIPAFLC